MNVVSRVPLTIVGSNPSQGMYVCVCVVLCVGIGHATGRYLVKGVVPSVYRVKKLKRQPRSNKRTVDRQTHGWIDR
jgi:hypothetical protein